MGMFLVQVLSEYIQLIKVKSNDKMRRWINMVGSDVYMLCKKKRCMLTTNADDAEYKCIEAFKE